MRIILSLCCLFFAFTAFAQDAEPIGWPRVLVTEKGKEITLYQPQIDGLSGKTIEGRMAISAKDDDGELVFGAIWLKAELATDFDSGLASFENIRIEQTKFPEEIPEDKVDNLKVFLVDGITNWNPEVSISSLKASLADLELEGSGVQGLNHEAPAIYYRANDAVLLIIDGEPILKEDAHGKVEYVVNSPFFIAREKGANRYYLRGGDFWYQSESIDTGWESIERVPKAISTFASENAPEAEEAEEEESPSSPPEIIVSTVPAELVLVEGEPDYQQIKETNLLYVKNTENDIVLDINQQQHYILIAGRFYTSKSLSDGSWTFVEPNDLPQDFAKIPEEESISSIKASVPGTIESKEALLEQSIPQTAEVDVNKTIEVTFDAEPQFKDVTGTKVAYAENSPQTVLRIAGQYYCVDEGIWFTSTSAKGTYKVSTERPDEVDDLPADSPVHHVKYVYVYETTPTVVYVGYTPGYYHSYAYGGVVVYGTGWYYRPWYGAYYYPRPVTYGFGVHWNPYTGWGFSVGVSYGWIGWGFHPYYRPYWGPRGFYPGYRHGFYHGYHRGYAAGYRAGYRAGQRKSLYNNRNGVRTMNNQNYRSQLKNRPSTNNRTRPTTKPSNRPNNVLADKNGNVFQRDNKGAWNNANSNRKNIGNGTKARPSTSQSQQLNRSFNNRQQLNRGSVNRGAAARGGGRRRN